MAVIGFVVFAVCVGLKVYIIHNCPSHPLFRVSPLFTTQATRDRLKAVRP